MTRLCSTRLVPALWLTLVCAWASGGCQPFAAVGEPCEGAPCALGLVCVEGTCEEPEPVVPDPAPCQDDAECAVQGNADGRSCVEGECVWMECFIDLQCGTRVCDRGECSPRQACALDDDCDDDKLCIDSACRLPCSEDGDCTGFFEVCGDDGRCRQQCFADLLCFGDLCVDGLCEPPECGADEDCGEPGNWFCSSGRCESFLPCDDDGDCFDPSYRCDDLGRCEERPLCSRDDECGLEGLCVDSHCRPTDSCLLDEEACPAGKECVAGRCASAPECRANADCGAGEVCARGACRDEALGTAGSIVVEIALGACAPDGGGACGLTLFPGEQARIRYAALNDEGAPVLTTLVPSAVPGGVLAFVSATRHEAWVETVGEGTTTVRVTEGSVENAALSVTVLPARAPTALRVLVIDERTGAPSAGALVTVPGASATTDALGVAVFDPAPSAEPGLITASSGGVGVAVADLVPAGDLRLALPAPAAALPSTAAGFSTRVTSTGDETGPVGVGLALSSQARLGDVSLSSLFGPPFIGILELPLLGGVPLPLPSAATLEATLPLVGGTSAVRPLAYSTTTAGPRSVTAFEGRYDTNHLFTLTGAGDEVELALELARETEGMDALWSHVGVIEALPLVEDAADLDGDGDVSERLPDFAELPNVEISPMTRPTERAGLVIGPPPQGARPRVLVVAGLLPTGYGFVPSGVGAFVLDDGAPRQLKVAPPAADALTASRRAVVVEAFLDDGSESRLQLTSDALAPSMELGTFLEPPRGALFLDGVPLPGDRLLLLPEAAGATTYRVRLAADGVSWDLYLAAGEGGRSVIIDDRLGGLAASLGAVEALRLPGVDATSRRFQAGEGPAAPASEVASARARAP